LPLGTYTRGPSTTACPLYGDVPPIAPLMPAGVGTVAPDMSQHSSVPVGKQNPDSAPIADSRGNGAPFEPGYAADSEGTAPEPARVRRVAGSKQRAVAVAPQSWPVTTPFPPIAATPGPGAVYELRSPEPRPTAYGCPAQAARVVVSKHSSV